VSLGCRHQNCSKKRSPQSIFVPVRYYSTKLMKWMFYKLLKHVTIHKFLILTVRILNLTRPSADYIMCKECINYCSQSPVLIWQYWFGNFEIVAINNFEDLLATPAEWSSDKRVPPDPNWEGNISVREGRNVRQTKNTKTIAHFLILGSFSDTA
jgi:hypothetical protein